MLDTLSCYSCWRLFLWCALILFLSRVRSWWDRRWVFWTYLLRCILRVWINRFSWVRWHGVACWVFVDFSLVWTKLGRRILWYRIVWFFLWFIWFILGGGYLLFPAYSNLNLKVKGLFNVYVICSGFKKGYFVGDIKSINFVLIVLIFRWVWTSISRESTEKWRLLKLTLHSKNNLVSCFPRRAKKFGNYFIMILIMIRYRLKKRESTRHWLRNCRGLRRLSALSDGKLTIPRI